MSARAFLATFARLSRPGATAAVAERVLEIMKTPALLAACSCLGLALTGCTATSATTTETQTDQTTKRVHTQEDLRKSGQSETGAALEKTDPAVRVSGH